MKDLILSRALKLCAQIGLTNVTRDKLAQAADVATGSVSYHLGDARKMRAAIVAQAIEERDLIVIAQAHHAHHPLTEKPENADVVALALRHASRVL